ncbi:MAG: carbohydrate ABC transporter permease [Spirochaetaceae bacterium]|jgi:multiple sugar transport system permease protein|nr:carbohydrate ABC transporter permease [Spirochaetaceae bacterium]
MDKTNKLSKDQQNFLNRRRWARVGVVYVLLISFLLLFLSPLMFSVVSSFKTNPLENPPNLRVSQLNPANWIKAGRLAQQAGGSLFSGGASPGHTFNFQINYFIPHEMQLEVPDVAIPRRKAGAGLAAVKTPIYAADYMTVSQIIESFRADFEYEGMSGEKVTFNIVVTYPEGNGPKLERVPMDILMPDGLIYLSSTLPASRIERRGRVASFNDITPGIFGYSLYNYIRVFKETQSLSSGKDLFTAWFSNSLFVAVARVILNLIFASMAGYALARYKFRGRTLFFIILLASQVLPGQVTFISNYLVMRDGIFGLSKLFGVNTLLNNPIALIVGGAGGSAMIESAKVFIMKQFFESLPVEIEEAAYIDGAGHFSTFFKVMLPISRPALGAVAILTFQGAWNDFFWPMIVLTSPEEVRTLPIGILYFRQIYGAAGDWGLILSGAVMSALPVVILFVVFQKYFLQGMSFGGSKG